MRCVNKDIADMLYGLGYDGPDSGMFWVDIKGKLFELADSRTVSEYGNLLYELERIKPAPYILDVIEWIMKAKGLYVWTEPAVTDLADGVDECDDILDKAVLRMVSWTGHVSALESGRMVEVFVTAPHADLTEVLQETIYMSLCNLNKNCMR